MSGAPYKRFKSTLTTHQGAPVWIIEEVQPEQPPCKPEEPQLGKLNIEDHMGEELDEKLSLLAEANLPGVSLQWDANEGWKFCFPEKPEPMPEKITLMMEQDDGEFATMPPVKYFDTNGQPVYYFEDPITGHKYWDECECDVCFADCLLNNDGMTPQQLRDQCKQEKNEDPKGKGKADEAGPAEGSASPNHPSS